MCGPHAEDRGPDLALVAGGCCPQPHKPSAWCADRQGGVGGADADASNGCCAVSTSRALSDVCMALLRHAVLCWDPGVSLACMACSCKPLAVHTPPMNNAYASFHTCVGAD